MTERIQSIRHNGESVMLIDLSQGSKEEILAALDEVQRQVPRHAPDSVLVLADFAGAHIDKAVATRMKEVLVFDRPYVKRSAWVGTESLPKVFYDNFKNFSRRDFPTFPTREAALDWLTSEK
jgi:hypothetical protein